MPLHAASPAVAAEIAFAKQCHSEGLTAHMIAAELRRRRLARSGPSPRGDFEEKRRRALRAIYYFAFDKAYILLRGEDDVDKVWELATELCEAVANGEASDDDEA